MAHNKILLVIEVLAALVVIWRTVVLAAHSKPASWKECRVKFVAHTFAYTAMIGGAIGIVFQTHLGHVLLLIGLALLFLSDRRATR